jgi:hypothetical protein
MNILNDNCRGTRANNTFLNMFFSVVYLPAFTDSSNFPVSGWSN